MKERRKIRIGLLTVLLLLTFSCMSTQAASNKSKAMKAYSRFLERDSYYGKERTWRGAKVYLPSEGNPYIGDMYEECDLLGNSILEYYCDYTGFQNSGIKYTDDTVGINWSGIPVAQVMLGCISDSKDEARLADSDNWYIMAEGIAAGIEDYLDDESDFVDKAEVEGWDDYSEDEYEDYEDYDENGSAEQEGGTDRGTGL